MLSLDRFRSTVAGTPDLLPYSALIAPDIVLGKGGELMAGFFFRGEDAESSPDSRLNYITEQMNNQLARFGSGWCMWVDAARLSSPGYPQRSESHFPNVISAMIDAERREMFEREDTHFKTEYALVIQYLPPVRSVAKLSEMIYDDDSRDDSDPSKNIIANFNKKLQDFQDGVGDLLHARRMGSFIATADNEPYETYESNQLVNYLHFAIAGEPIALRIPPCPMYLDSWLGYPSLWTGNTPKVGERFVSVVSIDGFPSHSSPEILSILENLPIAYRWSTRFIFMDQHEAESALKRYYKKWKQWIRGFWQQVFNTSNGVINVDAATMAGQVENAMNESKGGLVAHGYYTTVVVLMNESRALVEEQARYVRKHINGHGFNARIEEANATNAWLGSLPGMAYPNVRRPIIHTLNLAELLPLSGIWEGLSKNPCSLYPVGSPAHMQVITTGSTPFNLNLHVQQTGHATVFGPNGSGKSLLLGLLAAQGLRYQSKPRPDGSVAPASVAAFDKGGSMYALCKASGGQHYAIGADDEEGLVLCPLADIDTEADVVWAKEWIGTCYELQKGEPLSPNQKNEVHLAISSLKDKPKKFRTLTDFNNTVQDDDVRAAIQHYTNRGAMGSLLDGREDSLKDFNFTVFEVDELMNMGSANGVPVLLHLFRRFEKSLTGQPAFLFLDEAWIMLAHPIFREKIRQWLKEMRKKNCAVILATQSLSDAVRSGIMDTIIEQCPTKIFLPNHEADLHGTPENPGPAEYYAMFGLEEKEIQQIKKARYKQDYYLRCPGGRRWFQLAVGPLAMRFVGVSDKDSIRDVKACEKAHGKNWPIYWLKQGGVDYAKYV